MAPLVCGSLGALRFFYDLNTTAARLLCMTQQISFGITPEGVFLMLCGQQKPDAEIDTGTPQMQDARASIGL
jgi:hypothetical protein